MMAFGLAIGRILVCESRVIRSSGPSKGIPVAVAYATFKDQRDGRSSRRDEVDEVKMNPLEYKDYYWKLHYYLTYDKKLRLSQFEVFLQNTTNKKQLQQVKTLLELFKKSQSYDRTVSSEVVKLCVRLKEYDELLEITSNHDKYGIIPDTKSRLKLLKKFVAKKDIQSVEKVCDMRGKRGLDASYVEHFAITMAQINCFIENYKASPSLEKEAEEELKNILNQCHKYYLKAQDFRLYYVVNEVLLKNRCYGFSKYVIDKACEIQELPQKVKYGLYFDYYYSRREYAEVLKILTTMKETQTHVGRSRQLKLKKLFQYCPRPDWRRSFEEFFNFIYKEDTDE